MNRLGNCNNPYQGKYKRVLCVCSAGLLRSPTAAVVLSQEPFNFNTRACGLSDEYALIPIDQALIEWADEIVCMEDDHVLDLKERFDKYITFRPVVTLNIEDRYAYRDPELMKLIAEKYQSAMNHKAMHEKANLRSKSSSLKSTAASA